MRPPGRFEFIDERNGDRISDIDARHSELFPIHDHGKINDLVHWVLARDRHFIARKLWFPYLCRKPIMAGRDRLDQFVVLDPASCIEPQVRIGPKFFEINIRNGASRPVTGKACYASVRVNDLAKEICVASVEFFYDRDPVRTDAGMPLTHRKREIDLIDRLGDIAAFDNDVVVSEAVEFAERSGHKV